MILPIVLSGGTGTRLWPASRGSCPKQFLEFEGGGSLFQKTLQRFAAEDDFADPIVVGSEELRFLVGAQAQECGMKLGALLIEPIARNTAFAIAAAACHCIESHPDKMMLTMPADHLIANPLVFAEAIRAALPAALAGYLVTFGIKPTRAETGYGYIEAKDEKIADCAWKVRSFIEKPGLRVADSYFAGGQHYWNSGIFLVNPATLLSELAKHAPDLLQAAKSATRQAVADLDFIRLDRASMEDVEPISIDHRLIQVSKRVCVRPVTGAGWSDIGSWDSLYELTPRDDRGNAAFGSTVMVESDRNFAYMADGRVLITQGVCDLIIVSTADAILVSQRQCSQRIKELVDLVRVDRPELVETSQRMHRPWGYYEVLHHSDGYQVKHIQVKPGGLLSLQKHAHRAENWIVLKGTARVTRNDEVVDLSPNQMIYLPLGCKHRLENPGGIPLSIIEVQTGSYLGEDDIERFEDCYGRT